MINHYDYNALFLETINAHIDELILEDIAVTGKITILNLLQNIQHLLLVMQKIHI